MQQSNKISLPPEYKQYPIMNGQYRLGVQHTKSSHQISSSSYTNNNTNKKPTLTRIGAKNSNNNNYNHYNNSNRNLKSTLNNKYNSQSKILKNKTVLMFSDNYDNNIPIQPFKSNVPQNNNRSNNPTNSHNLNNNQHHHGIYEGMDKLNINSHQPFTYHNNEQFSHVTEVDGGFFMPSEYDNSTSNDIHTHSNIRAPAMPSTYNNRNHHQVRLNNQHSSTLNNLPQRMMSSNDQYLPTLSIPDPLLHDNSNNNVISPASSTNNFLQTNHSSNYARFETIRKNCFVTKQLFLDPEFPPRDSSIYRVRKPPFSSEIFWMRPSEIIELYNKQHGTSLMPEFQLKSVNNSNSNGYSNGIGAVQPCEIVQGKLGDCWVMAALSTILTHDLDRNQFLSRLVPSGQNFRSSWYTGAFLFRFWRNGEWCDVIIDDMLPTLNSKLIYIHNNENGLRVNEFWPALLEKAYAKLNGSYEALDSGQLADCLDDFTSGMTESYSSDLVSSNPSNNNSMRSTNENTGSIIVPDDIDDHLIRAFECHSLITVGILKKPQYQYEASVRIQQEPTNNSNGNRVVLPNGLVAGHAYTISDVRKIKLTTTSNNGDATVSDLLELPGSNSSTIVTLLRIRNPSLTRVNWRGAWSEKSEQWQSISEEDRRSVGLVFRSEGEFWISLSDFVKNFDTLDICHLPTTTATKTPLTTRRFYPNNQPISRATWRIQQFTGEWRAGVSGGGRPKLSATHYTNPQFRLDLPPPSPQQVGNSQSQGQSGCNMVVGLLQHDPRGCRDPGARLASPSVPGKGNLSIGFVIYQLKNREVPPLGPNFFKTNQFVASVDSFIDSREVVKRFNLMWGCSYLLVPCTYEAGYSGKFLMRVLIPSNTNMNWAGNNGVAPPYSNSLGNFSLVNSDQSDSSTRELHQIISNSHDMSTGSNKFLTPAQLQRLLNNLLRERSIEHDLSLECCRALIVLFGSCAPQGNAGSILTMNLAQPYRINEEQISTLWSWLLRALKSVQRAESLGPMAMRAALDSLGLGENCITDQTLIQLIRKFGNSSGVVSVSGYMHILAILYKHNEIFDSKKSENGITLTREEYLNLMTII